MNYAIIKSGGKQYRVSKGDVIEVERLKDLKEGDKVEFSEVLLISNGSEGLKIGKPYVGSSVAGVVKEVLRGDKIYVRKFKAKSNYRRTTGHRQSLTKVEITGFTDKILKEKNETKKSS